MLRGLGHAYICPSKGWRAVLSARQGNPEEVREHLCMPVERCTTNDSSVHRKGANSCSCPNLPVSYSPKLY
ncbi:hypothetical protein CABS01_11039 [Colletotrichum abscissum]|uniref:uncharacterized protein n=1 Tax=Colletotrichum abscissum TaxID=1671311 RepID=UPI0027D56A8C|nr:uncharacterized protein CABS01_11039 [Colletotrichum abscissum]KAK1496890.1 hypothetical protein CABS01_11039 [Colletotrichum abscissum]